MFELPTSLNIGGTDYTIRDKGDFRMVLDCFKALNDEELDMHNRVLVCLVIFFDGMEEFSDLEVFGTNLEVAIQEMFKFFNCGHEDAPGATTQGNVVDWESDSQLIASAINQVAGTEVRALEYLHWWTFMGYYLGIGKSAFATVIDIRTKIQKHKKLEKYELEFKNNNPQYFVQKKSKEEQDMEDYLRALWGNGGEKT